jgi:hypothetical protein
MADFVNGKDDKVDAVDVEQSITNTFLKWVIISLLVHTSHACKQLLENFRIYSVLVIPSSAKGLQKYGLGVPDDLKDQLYMEVVEGVPDQLQWESCLGGTGGMMNMHLDYHGAAQIMQHIHGDKLWLFWLPMAKNLAWWSAKHSQFSSIESTVHWR